MTHWTLTPYKPFVCKQAYSTWKSFLLPIMWVLRAHVSLTAMENFLLPFGKRYMYAVFLPSLYVVKTSTAIQCTCTSVHLLYILVNTVTSRGWGLILNWLHLIVNVILVLSLSLFLSLSLSLCLSLSLSLSQDLIHELLATRSNFLATKKESSSMQEYLGDLLAKVMQHSPELLQCTHTDH